MGRNRRAYLRRKYSGLILMGLALGVGAVPACSLGSNRRPESPPTSLPGTVVFSPTSSSAVTSLSQPALLPTPTLPPVPALDERDHASGNPDAGITLLVYSDFQSPFCADFFNAWKQIEARHPNAVRLVFRQYPLIPVHDKADLAGAAAEIAALDGAFWEMHDALFERQEEWASLSPQEFTGWVIQVAESIGLDPLDFSEALSSGTGLERMQRAYQSGMNEGIPGTPFIFFNSEWYRLNPTALNLEASIQLELLGAHQYPAPPQYQFDENRLYFAHLQLDRGEIVIQLLPELAPATVASYIFLAEEGWYNNTGFHRVQAGRVVETGDPSGTGLGGPGYLLLDEVSDTLNFDEAGMVAMSSSGPDTNGSRYFINLAPLSQLNGARTIFGRVIEGLDLLASLDERDPLLDLFEPYDFVIRSIRIESR